MYMDYYAKIKLFCDYIFNHLSNKKSTYERLIDEKDIEIYDLKVCCAIKEQKIQELYDELTILPKTYCETEKELIDIHKNSVRLLSKLEEEQEKHINIEQKLKLKIIELEKLFW